MKLFREFDEQPIESVWRKTYFLDDLLLADADGYEIHFSPF